jgi:glycine dehydrogenase subunit 1
MTLLGGEGLARLARINHARARQLAERLTRIPGVRLSSQCDTYFNEFTVILPRDAREVVDELAERRILGGVPLGRLYPQEDALRNGLLVTATETTTDEDIEALALALAGVLA